VTLDPDVEMLVKNFMRERGLSFKQAINRVIRGALALTRQAAPFSTPTFSMGFNPAVPFDKALRLASELEDEELVRKLATRK